MTAAISHTNDLSGWLACLELEFSFRHRQTTLTRNRHTGPLRIQRPFYPEKKACHAYILHPPGGIAGGDRLEIQAVVKTDAAALMTTPGATKFYRSDGRKAHQTQSFHVEKNGNLEWFPQESIFFPGAKAEVLTRIELDKEAGFIGWDIYCLGLPVCNHNFNSGFLKISLEINRDGCPLYLDRLRITNKSDMGRISSLRGFSVCGSFTAVGATKDMMDPLRQIISVNSGAYAGVTLMDDLLVARYLGDSSAEAKHLFWSLWKWLRPRLLGREVCTPRIWST